jgi:hypothetical protein
MEHTENARTYPLVETPPRALVIYCSDPRFQKAYAEFIRTDLGLGDGEFIPLATFGGIASLSEPFKLPKEFKFMKDRLEFVFENFKTVKRFILINHEDCRGYEELKSVVGRLFLQRVKSMSERQTNDLKTVAKMLLEYASPGMQVELYYARFGPGEPRSVVFEKILS